MARGRVRRMFPGGNTSLGFYSYYHNVLPLKDAEKMFVIKGGPGVGKSKFMQNIALEMGNRGYDIEYMHCSSDPNSLDGIVIPQIGTALIDGTAPHVVDPKTPGAIDEIINLGDFWNEAGIGKYRKEIIDINTEIGMIFTRAYRYLKAAASIYEDTSVIYDMAENTGKLNIIANDIAGSLFDGIDISPEGGRQRSLFASAITPEGIKNYLDTILTTSRVYAIKCGEGKNGEKLLNRIMGSAIERGMDVECFYCAFNPVKLEHIVISEMNVSFTTSNAYHRPSAQVYMTLELDEYVDTSIFEKHKEIIEYNRTEFDMLLERAIYTIGKAKALHDKLESYYIPNMDFDAVQRCREMILAKILEYTPKS